MSTATEISVQALREGNIIPLGTALTPEQSAEALLLLNRLVESLLGFELGEFSMDWPVPPSVVKFPHNNYYALPQPSRLSDEAFPFPPGNVRVILNLTAAQTIFMPTDPQDGMRFLFLNIGDGTQSLTVDGNGRLVKGSATITETATELHNQFWLYRSDLSNWILITLPMVAETDSPFPDMYDDLLAVGLFIRLAPRYGRSVSPETAATFKRMLKRMTAQYRQSVPQPSASPQGFAYPASDMGLRSGTSRSLFN